MSNDEFNVYEIEEGGYECHGCGTVKGLEEIELPNLCNHNLFLCPVCRLKLRRTLEDTELDADLEQIVQKAAKSKKVALADYLKIELEALKVQELRNLQYKWESGAFTK